jgi:hypothetical protein
VRPSQPAAAAAAAQIDAENLRQQSPQAAEIKFVHM